MTEGEYETPEQLYQALKEANEKVEGKTIMELLNEQVEEEYGEGVTYNQLVEFKSVDYDNMGSLDLIKAELMFNSPEITEDEIEAELFEFELMSKPQSEIDRMIEEKEITERDFKTAKARMMTRARQAKEGLKEAQNEIDLDGFAINVPRTSAAPQKSKEEVEAELAQYGESIKKFADFEVEVGTKENPYQMKISVSEDDRNGIQKFLFPDEKGNNWINRRWAKEDGSVDIDKLASDVHKIMNYERDLNLSFAQGKAVGLKQEVKDIDKIDLENKGGGDPAPGGDQKNIHADIANEIN